MKSVTKQLGRGWGDLNGPGYLTALDAAPVGAGPF